MKKLKDEKIIEWDRAWFKRHVGRRHYCRLASELEEMDMRERRPDEPDGQPVVIVKRINSKMRIRKIIIVPTTGNHQLLLPKTEEDCASIFNAKKHLLMFVADTMTLCPLNNEIMGVR